jgi:cobalamin synthase
MSTPTEQPEDNKAEKPAAGPRGVGIVALLLLFLLWPSPFGRFAPYGSWQFFVGVVIWVITIVTIIVEKWHSRKTQGPKPLKSPEADRL